MYSAVSQFIDPEYARKTLLLPGTTVKVTPKIGTILFDSKAKYRKIRDYMPLHETCPDVFAWHLTGALLTDEFVVHDGSRIFVDASIHCQSTSGRKIPEILDRFSQKLSESDSEVCSVYASETALVLHNEGGGTWGHFLVQNFPKVLLYLKHYPAGKIVLPRAHATGSVSNFAKIFELYGISEDRLLPIDRFKTYSFRELVLLDFMYNFDSQVPHPQALALLSDIRSDRLPDIEQSVGFFIKRVPGKSNRGISNGAGVEDLLAKFGVKSTILGTESVGCQIRRWKSSKLIISTLGSDLSNIVFGFRGQRILSLSPDWFGDKFFYNLAIIKGCQWNELRCGQLVERAEPEHKSSFNVDLEVLDVMLQSLTHFDVCNELSKAE